MGDAPSLVMTISTEVRRAGPYVGNNVQQAFPFSFKVFEDTDLLVTHASPAGDEIELVLGVNYDVTLNADQDTAPGGTVTTTLPVAPDWTITITSKVPSVQPVELLNQGGFYPTVLTQALDRVTILAQQNAEGLARAYKVPVSSTQAPGDLTGELNAAIEAVGEATAAANAATAAAEAVNDVAQAAQTAASGAQTAAGQAQATAAGAESVAQAAMAVAVEAQATATHADALRVVVLGDSLSAHQDLTGRSWPFLLGEALRASGVEAEVVNLAIGGWTFALANSNAAFGGRTMVQEAIAQQPDVVFVALGFNDCITSNGVNAVSAVIADATATFSALRAGLPSAKLVYVSELAYDRQNAAPAALKNKHIAPYFHAKRTTGILAGCWCREILDDAAPAAQRDGFADWELVDAAVRALPSVDASLVANLFVITRLGLAGPDGLHLKTFGQQLFAAYVAKGCRENAALTALWPNIGNNVFTTWGDPDILFGNCLVASGDGWVESGYNLGAAFLAEQEGDGRVFTPATWFLPSQGEFFLSNTTLPRELTRPLAFFVRGARPYTAAEVSLDGGAWVSAGRNTDARGDYVELTNATWGTVGDVVLRFRVGDEVLGPLTLTTTAVAAEPEKLRLDFGNAAGAAPAMTDEAPLRRNATSSTLRASLSAVWALFRTVLLGESNTWTGNNSFVGRNGFGGFTNFGESGPAIKTLLVTTTLPAVGTSKLVTVSGLNSAKVIGIQGAAYLDAGGVNVVPLGFTNQDGATGWMASVVGAQVNFITHPSGSYVAGQTVRVLLTYSE